MKAVFKTASPYAKDASNLPVADVEASIPFYEEIMGFKLVTRNDSPHKSAVLARDDIQIGLAENGGDPEQAGCFFEVDNAEAAFEELKANGLTRQPVWTERKPLEEREVAGFRIDHYGEKSYKVFFVVAPDGLCYCLGERQK
ncbi:MAG TPA: VOC family protein [Blastocatellia bacterium]|nr:VOC family protein [Blastocatellia bacterium]